MRETDSIEVSLFYFIKGFILLKKKFSFTIVAISLPYQFLLIGPSATTL